LKCVDKKGPLFGEFQGGKLKSGTRGIPPSRATRLKDLCPRTGVQLFPRVKGGVRRRPRGKDGVKNKLSVPEISTVLFGVPSKPVLSKKTGMKVRNPTMGGGIALRKGSKRPREIQNLTNTMKKNNLPPALLKRALKQKCRMVNFHS